MKFHHKKDDIIQQLKNERTNEYLALCQQLLSLKEIVIDCGMKGIPHQ